MTAWLINLRSHGLASRATMLWTAMVVAFALGSPIVVRLGGYMALDAAALAAVLCLAGATLALVVSSVLRGPNHAFLALGIGTAARLGIPLLPAMLIHLQGGPLAEAGLLYYLLVFYPVALVVEIALSLPPRPRPTPPETASSDARP
jgi:hypothetical protein